MTAPRQDGGTSQAVTGGTAATLKSPGTGLVPPCHHGHDLTVRWPLRSFKEFGARPSAVPGARTHARQVVLEWGRGLAGLAGSAELIVSGTGHQRRGRVWGHAGGIAGTALAGLGPGPDADPGWRPEPATAAAPRPQRGCRQRTRAAAGRGGKRPLGLASRRWARARQGGLGGTRRQRLPADGLLPVVGPGCLAGDGRPADRLELAARGSK